MSRREVLIRLVVGIPYLLLYLVFLFPAVIVIGIVTGLIDVLWRLGTGSSETAFTRVFVPLWDTVGGNARWVLTGRGEFRLMPAY